MLTARFMITRRILAALFAAVITAAGVLYSLAPWRAAVPQPSDPIGRFANDTSLRFVAVVFRHGDRPPFFKYKTDPHANVFPGDQSEITKGGKRHMYKKGQIFRNFYNGFLRDLYLDSEIITKSTKVRRTQMSAAMVLAGLYPPKDYQNWLDSETVWQPIPIYHDSPDGTGFFYHPEMCPAFDSIKDHIFQQIIDNFNITESLLSYFSEKCGQPMTKRDAYCLYDLFKCQESAKLRLPEWLQSNYFQTLKSSIENDKALNAFYGNSKLHKLCLGHLQEIVLDMDLHSNSTKSQNILRKMHLYSGHDFSVGWILNFLNIFEFVNFGASIHFHLHFDEKIGYIVKVFYFDQWYDEIGRELKIPNCGDNCKLQEFIKLVSDSFPRKWEEECQIIEK